MLGAAWGYSCSLPLERARANLLRVCADAGRFGALARQHCGIADRFDRRVYVAAKRPNGIANLVALAKGRD